MRFIFIFTDSKIPSFETCEVTSVHLKDEVVCQLSLSDEDDDVIVEGLDEDSFTVSPNKTLIFKIVNTEPIQLRYNIIHCPTASLLL